MGFFDNLFTELTGIERYVYSTPPCNIKILSEHYTDIFGTGTGVVVVATDYSESVAKLLHRAKYVGDTRALDWVLPTLNETMEYILELDRVNTLHKTPTQFVLGYVPIGINRIIERGFNQSRFLAKSISNKYSIPFERLAILPWSSGHQSRRTKQDRTVS